MLEIKNWSKTFHGNQVLKNIELSVNEGEVLTIIGPSGSGKSTLLRSINFLEPADSGEMILDEEKYEIDGITKQDILAIRRQTAMIFQNYALFSKKTAKENVMEALVMVQKKSKEESKELAESYLTQVGMANYIDFYPQQLSGGQKQRVGIARALAIQPKVLLLDEPTSALDPELVQGILELINDIAHQKTTMILVTHEMNFAKKVSDHVIFLEKGEILEEGTSDDIFLHPTKERTKQFIQGFQHF